MTLLSEIREQPAVLERQLEARNATAEEIAVELRRRTIRQVVIAARGSSDNAALYAKYLGGWLNRIPVALATPSLHTLYAKPPALREALVVGISQSGESPDIVRVVRDGRRDGAVTLAITNEPGSPLAREADLVFATEAGAELAVAATKTYTAQLLGVAMVAAATAGDRERLAELERVPELVRQTLELDEAAREAAENYPSFERCVVLGRGFHYATVREWSLKLQELTYAVAEPYSSADFRHGPLAVVSAGFPVLAVAPAGATYDSVCDLLEVLVEERGADLMVLSNGERALAGARRSIRLAPDLPEWLSPLVAIVPAQLFCYHLTRALGRDTERPRGLSKVTRTL